jgi:hypothetical protein
LLLKHLLEKPVYGIILALTNNNLCLRSISRELFMGIGSEPGLKKEVSPGEQKLSGQLNELATMQIMLPMEAVTPMLERSVANMDAEGKRNLLIFAKELARILEQHK